MNYQIKKLHNAVAKIQSKFEEVKKLDGTRQDSSPKGDGYVEIYDEYESRGHIQFDQGGRPLAMRYSEWEPNDLGFDEMAGDTTSYYISEHESGYHYYFSEISSANGDVWSPGPRVAVDPSTGEVAGTFDISHQPHKFTPLPETD